MWAWETLRTEDIPTPGRGEVLVKVMASNINPATWWHIWTAMFVPLTFPYASGNFMYSEIPLPETFCLSLISDSECLCTPQQVDHKIVEMAGWSWTYPHKLGYDVAGVIQALGPNCMRLHVGDEVWGEAGAFGAFGAFNIKADPFPRLPCQRPPL